MTEAMLQVLEQGFDLVFLDICMPVDGPTVVKELLDLRPDTTIVMMTGYADNDLIQRAISDGARMCISKPFLPQDVLEVTEQILEKPLKRRGLAEAN